MGMHRVYNGRGARLMNFFSFRWTMRVIALIEFFMLAIANLVGVFLSGSIDIDAQHNLL